ncbi:MAG: autorepressor SdpR family transcription factor [Patescibacteria group bacterium]|nr:autorepressor SdpR family transcription factor [Patescibacteria group bacterium]
MENVFKALADPNRRKILELLKKRSMSVTDLLEHFDFTQASLSHHLDILKRANLVITERQGQFIFYSLNLSVFEEISKAMFNLFQYENRKH